MDPAALQVLQHVLTARRRGENERVVLPGMDLRGANLLGADLLESDLSGAGLDGAHLAGAKLGRSALRGAMLGGANLAGADLTEADLRDADLSGARLEGASLAGADLRGACIEDVIGEPSTVAGSRIDKALVNRSHLRDDDVIQLWSEGVVIDDLEAFDEVVRTVCDLPAAASDVGPSSRHVAEIETEARRQRLTEERSMPPSARVERAVAEAAAAEAAAAERPGRSGHRSLSLRSLRLVADILTPEMLAAPSYGVGDRVMGVTLQAEIGSGNVAVVYRGTYDDGAEVAVKLFKTHMTNQGLCLPSFRRGIQVMNRLTAAGTEGVVPVLAVSINRLGMLMPLAQNGSAADLPALGWDTEPIVDFMLRLCGSVQAAHDAGVLHRCLKPSNILLDDELRPFVADFDVIDLPSLSDRAGVGGYAPYAPPEELLGQSTQSPTSDVYALGRILAFLLRGDHPRATAEARPALRDLGDAPEGLVRIVRRCTMRAPERRYQTVAALRADLERYDDTPNVGIGRDDGDDGGTDPPHPVGTGGPSVSGLPHRTRWLGKRDRAANAAASSPVARERTPAPAPATAAARRKRPPGGPDVDPEPRKLSVDRALGSLGILAVLASLLVVLSVDAPSDRMVTQMRWLSTAGGALMVLWLPRTIAGGNVLRVLFALALGAALYFVDLPAFVIGR
ncbi:MAG: pentapeptide repeat-containing protein [Myxococcota bacterium]